MSGISISFLYCWYHYTNSHFVCIIATASLVSKFKTVISFAPPRSHRSIGLSSRGHFDHFFWAPPGSHRSIGFSTFERTHRQVYFLEIDMATWPKGPQKLKFEHAICILKLLILECGSFWPVLAGFGRLLTFLGCVRTYFLTRLTPGWRKYATQTPSNYKKYTLASLNLP